MSRWTAHGVECGFTLMYVRVVSSDSAAKWAMSRIVAAGESMGIQSASGTYSRRYPNERDVLIKERNNPFPDTGGENRSCDLADSENTRGHSRFFACDIQDAFGHTF